MNESTEIAQSNGNGQQQMVANPFGADPQGAENQAPAIVESNRALAEVQGMITVAKKFPRDSRQCMQAILDDCTRVSLAEQSEYAYPKGGQQITGPSIRLAETIARHWGNIDFGIIELSQENGRSTMQAYAWDLQTNVRQVKTFQVEHMRKTRTKTYRLDDPRDIYELTANQGARRLRACILGIIPGDVIETAVNQCRLTQQNKMGAPEEAIEKMVEAFEKLGVYKAQIMERLGHNLKSVTHAEVLRLRQIYKSISDGMSTPDSWFGKHESKGAADLNAELEKEDSTQTEEKSE